MTHITLYSLHSKKRAEPLVNQIPKDLLAIADTELQRDGSQVVSYRSAKTRLFRKTRGDYLLLACTQDQDRVNSKRLFEADADAMLAAAETIEQALLTAEARTRRLLHNLKSLTAKMSQEIFDIARQDRLVGSPREAVPYVASEIKADPEGAARALLEVLKHLSAQKAEYTAFDRLSGKLDTRYIESHSIHRVLMNVFYLFFGEFLAKRVFAEVDRTTLQARFDYDSVHVCIYYLVENAAKYVRPGSQLQVTTAEDGKGFVDIRFIMESLFIEPQESDKIFDEGYSGAASLSLKLNGAGIGLYLARAMAVLNGGQLNVIPGTTRIASLYARNSFILTLPAR